MLHFQNFLYLSEIIKTKIISKYHDNPFAGYFKVKKTWKLVAWKYYLSNLQSGMEAYIKRCDVCVAFKAVKYKPYSNLQ